jgi:tetratricopeptide (TPR) repeat protein
MRDFSNAVAEAERALSIDAKCADALCVRGAVKLLVPPQTPDEALADLDRATELDPESELPYLFRAMYWRERGNLEKARQEARRGEKQLPRTSPALEKLAAVYEYIGDLDKAIELQTQAVELAPFEAKSAYTRELARLQAKSAYPIR